MRIRPLLIIALILAIALAAAGAGAYAFDQQHRDKLANGVRIGGVPVGGLSTTDAHQRLEERLVAKLRRPLRVDHGDRRWILGARESRIRADVRASVDDALARSRDGNLLTRTWREATGGELDADLTPEVSYSDAAIMRLIDRVRKEVDRPARDAKAELGLSGPSLKKSRTGRAVNASALHKRMRRAIASATASRRLSATTHKVKPKVTDAEARKGYDTALVVNRGAFTLTVYKGFKRQKSYKIAVGAAGLETPAGTYHIQNKAVNPAWTKPNSSWVAAAERGQVVPGGTPQNPLKARWMGIFDGAGIHGVDPSQYGTLGSAASHGCVRMRIPDVIELYNKVSVGTPIYIG